MANCNNCLYKRDYEFNKKLKELEIKKDKLYKDILYHMISKEYHEYLDAYYKKEKNK